MSLRVSLLSLCLAMFITSCDEPHSPVEPKTETRADRPAPGSLAFKYPVEVVPRSDTESDVNLLSDASFESGAGELKPPWQTTSTGLQVNAMKAAEGRFGLKAQPPFSISQSVLIRDGGEYVARVFYRMVDSESPLVLQMEDGRKGKERFMVEFPPMQDRLEAWSAGVFHFYIPAYVHVANFRLSAASNGKPIYIDNVELRRSDALRENLVRNPGFDLPTSPQNWQYNLYLTRQRVSPGVSSDDAFCMRVSPKPAENVILKQQIRGLTPGNRYRARGYFKTEDLNGDAYLHITNTSRNTKKLIDFRSESVSGTTDWKMLETDFVLPKGVRKLQISARFNVAEKNVDKVGIYWVDHFEFFELRETQ